MTLARFTAAEASDNTPPSQSTMGQIAGHVYRSDTAEPVPKGQARIMDSNTI
jgi:hypothetical protein